MRLLAEPQGQEKPPLPLPQGIQDTETVSLSNSQHLSREIMRRKKKALNYAKYETSGGKKQV